MVRLLVLQTLRNPAAYSPNNALLTLARRMDRTRLAMTVATPREGLLTDALREAGIPVVCLGGLRTYRRHDALWRFPAVALRVAKGARGAGADVLLSNHAELGPFADAAARLVGIPWVCMLRQADRSLRYYEKYRVARADAVAAVSVAALQGYRAFLEQKRLPGNPLRVIPTGIDLPDAAAPAAPGAVRGGSPAPPAVGTVGLRSVKRPEVLLQIFSRVHQRLPGTRCIAVGALEAPEQARLEALCAGMGLGGRVEFPGHQRDMAPWYRSMSVYAHTSESEALPKVVLEAMAHGLPVVAFRVGGIAEAVENGVTGVLLDEGDQEGFAEALRALLADPALAARLGQAGRARVTERFSTHAMAEGMTALFEEVVASRRGAERIAPRPGRIETGKGTRG